MAQTLLTRNIGPDHIHKEAIEFSIFIFPSFLLSPCQFVQKSVCAVFYPARSYRQQHKHSIMIIFELFNPYVDP